MRYDRGSDGGKESVGVALKGIRGNDIVRHSKIGDGMETANLSVSRKGGKF